MPQKAAENHLYIKAKKEFEEAFAEYSALMHKHFGIVQEMPELYYSEKLAEQNMPQTQTTYYKKEAEKIQKKFARRYVKTAEVVISPPNEPERRRAISERNLDIYLKVRTGNDLETIAREYSLSKERIRQIYVFGERIFNYRYITNVVLRSA
jgi:hypothetical protein